MTELLGSVRPTGRESAVPKGPKATALTPGPRASLQATVEVALIDNDTGDDQTHGRNGKRLDRLVNDRFEGGHVGRAHSLKAGDEIGSRECRGFNPSARDEPLTQLGDAEEQNEQDWKDERRFNERASGLV